MGACFCVGRGCPKYDQCFPRAGRTFVGGPIGIYLPPTIPSGNGHGNWVYGDIPGTVSTGGAIVRPNQTESPTPARVEIDLCATCRHFKVPDGPLVFPVADRIGECRRNPPMGDRQWPKVGGADECGQWERRRG